MRPTTVSVTAVANSAPIPVDYRQSPFNASFAVVVTGTITYSVQHTFDDIFDPAVTPVWFDHATVVDSTVNSNSNYAFPVRAVRIEASAGTGSATLTWLQGKS